MASVSGDGVIFSMMGNKNVSQCYWQYNCIMGYFTGMVSVILTISSLAGKSAFSNNQQGFFVKLKQSCAQIDQGQASRVAITSPAGRHFH
ncbi:hypothetical protein T4C_3413 [Trichinella pseudospiralis]|uniref:Uncharacterized protein n=1 Tax=Trichinella pseudospiralis TaxID=6337 RepID=A0A0V1K1J4_TRIPS|nr:hypothetical protein T4C_3413 [Trichinella pseudospiralis]